MIMLTARHFCSNLLWHHIFSKMTEIINFSEKNLTVNIPLLLYVLYSYRQHVFTIVSSHLWVLNIFNTHTQKNIFLLQHS